MNNESKPQTEDQSSTGVQDISESQTCSKPNVIGICQIEENRKLRRRQAVARYREKNREKERLRNKEYRSTPEYKEKHRIKMEEWRKNNPEKQKEISRKNYKVNGHKQNERKRYLLKNDKDFAAKIKEREAKYKASGRRALMHKKRYEANRGEEIRKSREWKQNNPEKVSSYLIKFRDKFWNEHVRGLTQKLDDTYVVKVIKKQSGYKLKTEEIPKNLIEIKRQALKLKRELKTKKQKL